MKTMQFFKALTVLLMVGLTMSLAVNTGQVMAGVMLCSVTAVALAGWLVKPEPTISGAMLANTLTDLIPNVYAALDVVSKEMVGFIPSVGRDVRADRCALNAKLKSPVVPVNGAADIVPAMALPSRSDQVIGNREFVISKARAVAFSWTGEEEYSLDTGVGSLTVQQDQIAQAFRALVNEMEADIALAAALGASRAYGAAGTTPFATTLGDTAQVRKILDDNGAPLSGRFLIGNTSMGANLRTLQHLTKVNESGTTMTLRDGELLNLHGFSIKESSQVATPAVGTGNGHLINNGGGYAIGATALTVDTGSGTILAGDIVTIGSHKYVVAQALTSNVVTIAEPGLRAAVADNATVVVTAASVRNIAGTQNSILFGTRLPALPGKGDLATDRETITDPRTGIAFELAYYPGYRMGTYQLMAAWGQSVMKSEHLAVLLG